MESDSIANVYSEAKSEYMLQLTQYLTPAYFRFYLDLLARAKDEMKDEPKRYLWQFQNLLAEIEDWNMERVTREIANINADVERSGCDFLEDLLTAVFIAHTKVLAAVRLNSKTKNVQISLPKIDRFLFKVYCECSRLLWQSAYLFRENVGSMEKQQNYRQIQSIINDGIKAAIRSLVPVKSVLKDCINSQMGDNDHDSSDSDNEEAPAPLAPMLLETHEEVKEEVKEEVAMAEDVVEEEVKEETTEEPTEEVVEEAMAVDPATDAEAILAIVKPVIEEQVNSLLAIIADLKNQVEERIMEKEEEEDVIEEVKMSAFDKFKAFRNTFKNQ